MRPVFHSPVSSLHVLANYNVGRSRYQREAPQFAYQRISGFRSVHVSAHKNSAVHRVAVEHRILAARGCSPSHSQGQLRGVLQILREADSGELHIAAYPAGTHDNRSCVHKLHKACAHVQSYAAAARRHPQRVALVLHARLLRRKHGGRLLPERIESRRIAREPERSQRNIESPNDGAGCAASRRRAGLTERSSFVIVIVIRSNFVYTVDFSLAVIEIYGSAGDIAQTYAFDV